MVTSLARWASGAGWVRRTRSNATGRAVISWNKAGWPPETLGFRWAESGGPPLEGKPERRGFGTQVLDRTVQGKLGGAVSLAWNTSGLVCEIEVPLRPKSEPVNLATAPRAG